MQDITIILGQSVAMQKTFVLSNLVYDISGQTGACQMQMSSDLLSDNHNYMYIDLSLIKKDMFFV